MWVIGNYPLASVTKRRVGLFIAVAALVESARVSSALATDSSELRPLRSPENLTDYEGFIA
jgi:hypothetical protein